MQPDPTEIPYGYCHCGCGAQTGVAKQTDARKGTVKGQPLRFLRGHHNKKGPDYIEDPDTGCWVWQRTVHNGYGLAWHNGRKIGAHRAYYEKLVGPIPAGLHIDHLCRNKACVNPDHLEPVTNAENNRRGSHSKLDWPAVQAIRASKEPLRLLAARYGIAHSTVKHIRCRTNWNTPTLDQPRDPKVEYHNGEPACVGQWCCGCAEHPIGKPWGWNVDAWERHNARHHYEPRESS